MVLLADRDLKSLGWLLLNGGGRRQRHIAIAVLWGVLAVLLPVAWLACVVRLSAGRALHFLLGLVAREFDFLVGLALLEQ